MSRFVLDTGMSVGMARAAGYAGYARQRFNLYSEDTSTVVSIVSQAEMLSLAIQWGWGQRRRDRLEAMLRSLVTIRIDPVTTVERYAEIDAYSRGKHPDRPLPAGTTSRTMGKNDVWIAATASVMGATLLTTDRGFDHLDPEFLKVVYIDQSLTPDSR
jgi:tRNA(fMet)-specific endonuclease VapC